jgi:hypothetical protein
VKFYITLVGKVVPQQYDETGMPVHSYIEWTASAHPKLGQDGPSVSAIERDPVSALEVLHMRLIEAVAR